MVLGSDGTILEPGWSWIRTEVQCQRWLSQKVHHWATISEDSYLLFDFWSQNERILFVCVALALLVLNETKSRRCLPSVIWSFSAPFKGRLASQSQCVHCQRKSDRRRIVWKGSRRKSEVRKNEARFSLWQSNLLYSELLMVWLVGHQTTYQGYGAPALLRLHQMLIKRRRSTLSLTTIPSLQQSPTQVLGILQIVSTLSAPHVFYQIAFPAKSR